MKCLSLLFIIFPHFVLFSQSIIDYRYDREVLRFDLHEEEDHEKNIQKLMSLYDNYPEYFSNYLDIADHYASIKKTDSAIVYYCHAIKKQGTNKQQLQYHIKKNMVKDTSGLFNVIDTIYPIFKQEYYRKIDVELTLKIEKLMERDQTIRKLLRSLKTDSIFMSLYEHENQLIYEELVKIVSKKGWPTNVSSSASINFFLMVKHNVEINDSARWNYFSPIMEDAVEKGSLNGNLFSLFVDQNLFFEKGYQRYGYFGHDNFQGKTRDNTKTYYPILDIKSIDNRRKQIGLAPLYMDAAIRKLALPTDYER